jgi:broad specificity phosphatase PhoE
MRIIFARHGESQANIERVISNSNLRHPLTERGREQSRALAARLAPLQISAIYASPILRAQETAAIIGGALGLPVETADGLREFHCGIVEGRGDAEAWAAHNAVVAAWDRGEAGARIPEGESLDDLRARFVPLIDQLVERYRALDATIVLVTHGMTITLMLPVILSNLDSALSRSYPLGNCVCIFASLSDGRLRCDSWDTIAFPDP